MTKREAREYLRRWERVNAQEMEELRSTPFSVRFAQTSALMRTALALNWQANDRDEDARVARLWNRLREKLCE